MLSPELLKDIELYCKLNNIEVNKTINECLKTGFNLLKYKAPSNKGYQPITDNILNNPPPESGTGNSNNLYSE